MSHFSRRDFSADDETPVNWPRVAFFLVSGLILVWLVVAHTFSAYLIRAQAPETALMLGGGARARLTVVEEEIDRASSSGKPLSQARLGELRAEAEASLRADPSNARAYRILGQIALLQHDEARAEAFMRQAAQLSPHEILAIDWMMRRSFIKKDFASAAAYGDAMLNANVRSVDMAIPVLGRMAGDAESRAELVKILARNPPWRFAFFSALNKVATDARLSLVIFMAMSEAGAPPTDLEINSYLRFLVQHKSYDVAYFAWLQFLPPEKLEAAGFLFNGGFETTPTLSPFDWAITQGAGASIGIAPRPDKPGERALTLNFQKSRAEFFAVDQYLALPPGAAYRFKGSIRGQVSGRRGLTWTAYCAEGLKIGESEMILGNFGNWSSFEFKLATPETNCVMQYVRLTLPARSASEQIVSGSVQFDDLTIERDDAAAK